MSQSSLAEQFKEAGFAVKRGVKVINPDGQERTREQQGSDFWLYRWANNSFRNYPIVSRAKGVRHITDSAIAYPAIIVGIGPSLDAALPALKAVAGRAIMIATDAALRPLMANGIRPDLVLTFDCKPEQRLLWESVPDHDIPLLIDSCAHPDTIAAWRGPILFYNHWHQTDELSRVILPHVFPLIGQIPSGATVGNVALILSKMLGCSTTLTVGMDFCYAKTDNAGWQYRSTDYCYYDGRWVVSEIKELYDNDARMARSFVRTLQGVDFRMDPELEHYRNVFMTFITHFKVATINTSTEGSLKDVVATMPIREAFDRFLLKTPHLIPFYQLIKELGPDPRVSA